MCSNFRIVSKTYNLELRKRGGASGVLPDGFMGNKMVLSVLKQVPGTKFLLYFLSYVFLPGPWAGNDL